MKLCRVDVCETVRCFLYGARLGQIARKAISVLGLFLTGIRHVGRDIHQASDRWIVARFGDDRSPIAMGDKNAWSILKSKCALRSGHVFFKGRLRLLDDADVVTIIDKNVVDAFPAGTICPSSMHQNNILDATLGSLR